MANWKTTKEDGELIDAIADRFLKYLKDHKIPHMAENPKLHTVMDVTAVHLNVVPLRLKELLEADDYNFMHDMNGIDACLERDEPFHLKNHFLPRFSKDEGDK